MYFLCFCYSSTTTTNSSNPINNNNNNHHNDNNNVFILLFSKSVASRKRMFENAQADRDYLNRDNRSVDHLSYIQLQSGTGQGGNRSKRISNWHKPRFL